MTDWLAQFLSHENFEAAWQKVYRKGSGAGVDGETIDRLATHSDEVLTHLLNAVKRGTYRPLPLKPFSIPKPEAGWRQLAVPTVRDRIVQQALLTVLHQILEPQFEASSFAYRPGRSYLSAVRQVQYWQRQGYEWVLDADLVQYFDQLNHDRLFAEVAERVAEPPFLKLIQGWLGAGIHTEAGLILPQRGIPQGAVISPILANVYLDDFDEAFLRGQTKLVRFADDFVVLARSEKALLKVWERVERLLDTMGLQLHPDKTQITTFSKGFKFLGHTFVGDLVVENRSRKRHDPDDPRQVQHPKLETIIHADPVGHSTVMAQALLRAVQQQERAIPSPLYVVLGYKPREEKRIEIESKDVAWVTGMSMLYLVNQGSVVRRVQGRLVVERKEGEDIEVLINEVRQILIFGNIQLTTPVITTCLEEGITVLYLSQTGQYKGHLWSENHSDLTVEMAQFERVKDEKFKLMTAQAVVRGKLWNSRQLLWRLNRSRSLAEVEVILKRLADLHEQVLKAEMLDEVRGYEGSGAAFYFTAFGMLINHKDFQFTKRTYHPPLDPVNAMLSFGYTLLFNNVFSLVLAEGLNPHLGNLHGAERAKAYLAFDLMEEFRSPIVDTVVMQLINQKVMKPSDFTWPKENGGVYLCDAARRVFIRQFEDRIADKITHPDLKEKVSYRRAIHLQVRRYVHSVLGTQPYEPYKRVS
jgi:CRISPR-associated protein Cas1